MISIIWRLTVVDHFDRCQLMAHGPLLNLLWNRARWPFGNPYRGAVKMNFLFPRVVYENSCDNGWRRAQSADLWTQIHPFIEFGYLRYFMISPHSKITQVYVFNLTFYKLKEIIFFNLLCQPRDFIVNCHHRLKIPPSWCSFSALCRERIKWNNYFILYENKT